MSAKKLLNIQPILLTNVYTTNLLNPNITSLAGPIGFAMSQPYLEFRKARVLNRSNAQQTCSFWKGATAGNVAGTEVFGGQIPIPAYGYVDVFYGRMRLDAADFLVGGASALNALVLTIDDVELGISG